ncbi:hypothetical protein Tco_0874257 [Tanacetum coccineum]|uniref:Uncharacterized protein n=1 Tax=Tanacetum coccineum TaxID=301880 RepID=A0ABQ5BLG6_9ASTR
MQQPMPNPEDISDPIMAMNMELVLMDKAFKLNYSTTTKKFHQTSTIGRLLSQIRYNAWQIARNLYGYNTVHNVENQVGQNAVQNPGIQNVGNQNELIVVTGIANQNGNGNVVAARAEVMTQLLIAQKEEAGIQLQTEEFDLMAAAGDIYEIGEMDKLSVEHSGGTVEHHPATVEETRTYFESLHNNLVTEVEKVNTVNRKMKETNADLTTELSRYRVHQEIHKIFKDEIAPIANQVDARVQNFKNHFVKEAAKFVQDFKSLAKEAFS